MSVGMCLRHVAVEDLWGDHRDASQGKADIWLPASKGINSKEKIKLGASEEEAEPGSERADHMTSPWGGSQSRETKQVRLMQFTNRTSRAVGQRHSPCPKRDRCYSASTICCSAGPVLPDLQVFKRSQTAGFLCAAMRFSKYSTYFEQILFLVFEHLKIKLFF